MCGRIQLLLTVTVCFLPNSKFKRQRDEGDGFIGGKLHFHYHINASINRVSCYAPQHVRQFKRTLLGGARIRYTWCISRNRKAANI